MPIKTPSKRKYFLKIAHNLLYDPTSRLLIYLNDRKGEESAAGQGFASLNVFNEMSAN